MIRHFARGNIAATVHSATFILALLDLGLT
jgi:hypothetical protein